MGQARRSSERQEHEDQNSSVDLASERSWALAGEGHAGLWGEAKLQRVIEPAALGRDALHIQAAPPPAIPGSAAFPWTVSPLPSPCLQPFKMAQLPVISEEDQASSIPRLLPSPCVYLASYCLGPGGNRVCAAWHLQAATCLSECCQGQVTGGLPSMKFPGQRDHSCPFYSPRRGFQELGKEAEQSAGA